MPLRVLIVEDDMLIAMALEDILERAGHFVSGLAIDLDGALASAEAAGADLAIMDVDLARGACGVDTAKLLRERFNIPSLYVSAKVDDELRARASAWGPVGFIGKPFQERQILAALREPFE